MRVEIALIRHGATAGNRRGAYIGCTDEPLCIESTRQLQLDRQRGRYPTVETVFCSPLRRCVQTAQIVYPQRQAVCVEALRECDFGQFEGKSHHQLSGHPAYQRWLDSGGRTAFPGGEDPVQFRRRCWRGFTELCAGLYRDERAAVVCHGGTIMAVLEQCGRPRGDFYRWQVKNGGGYRFYFDTETQMASEIRPL